MSRESKTTSGGDERLLGLRFLSDEGLDATQRALEAKAGDPSQTSHAPVELVEVKAELVRRHLIARGIMDKAGQAILPKADTDPTITDGAVEAAIQDSNT